MDKASDILVQLLEATAASSQQIAHRDLKLGNMLLYASMCVKRADFRLSYRIPEGKMVSAFCRTLELSTLELFLPWLQDPF